MKVCVLVPAYNEKEGISRSIESALAAGIKPEDVFVIDDGSKDNTAEIARGFHVQVLCIQNCGKSRALKKGFEYFRISEHYRWAAIIDADSIIDKGYFSAMEITAERYPNAALICGNQRSQRGRWNWLTAFRSVEYEIWCSVYRVAQHKTGTIMVAPGFASVYRTDVLGTLDFEAGTLVEDMDMTIQLQRRKELIVFSPDAVVHTQDPLTLHDFIGQVKRWQIGTWQVIWRHRLGRHRSRVDVEMLLLVGDTLIGAVAIASLPMLLWSHPKIALWSLFVNQLFMLYYAIKVALRDRRADVLVFWPTFTVPRFLGTIIFVWAFFVQRRTRTKELKWFNVRRY